MKERRSETRVWHSTTVPLLGENPGLLNFWLQNQIESTIYKNIFMHFSFGTHLQVQVMYNFT